MAEIDTFEVTADNIFIDPELPNGARTTPSGFYLPDRTLTSGKVVHQIPKAGRVAAVGPDVPSYITVGMRVIIKPEKVIGHRLSRDEGYLIVKPHEVLGEVTGDGHIS